MSILFVTGGIRSGKSAFAEQLAARSGGDSVLYVATGQAWDEEMAERIKNHQVRRPASWQTREEPLALSDIATSWIDVHTVLLETLSGWVANLLFTYPEEKWGSRQAAGEIRQRVEKFLKQCESSGHTWVIVSDEAGLGGVAATPLGRAFQDAVGDANQQAAALAEEVYFVAAGLPLLLKGNKE
ncbi:bifunctional adenosylcobinamide kinase/adenosylcobinamide-phosphate guanylyltransferase [Brevibacillus massiliensis]|jgi:adenosylcobinamide kinase/adenosylcobinamide-phosphate guanylyltransferase|uniref:bifunctional adenosylcobinamide kinase/adenosylcobinamide-phosphate guanylyltransferase n=1 Tax=Brevibacillus massiliensis TaxID=1118054 RepID=UPI000311B4DE|nr:bifunctional adenosylcobinamide kinase/adenosylcobinamide-phosphate guanylyltransferase [Brevibacillus massiliensis]